MHRIEAKRGGLGIDLRELYRYRDLLRFLALRDLKVLYKQTILGFGWAIVRPVVTVAVFSVVFGRLANMPSDGAPYFLFSLVAMLPWTYLSDSITAASQSLVQQREMLTKVYFPRLFLPWTPILTKLVDLALAFGILVLVLSFYGRTPSAGLWALPWLVLLLMATAAGLGMILGALAVRYRDVQHGLPFLVQLMMYAAPVVWPVSLLEEKLGSTARLLYGLYPVAGAIEGFRSAVLGTTPMPWDLLRLGSLTALGLVLAGIVAFRRMERSFADVV